ncbi:MAG: hypothetical protein B7Y88_04185 [Sphingomonadales bacterium 32-64-17]|nr:MAG: hypothetical protein B7Y88_04185 [Sphingomonadales bacterium 32-64-17]
MSGFRRDELSAFIAVGIELVDAMDGDPDIEPNGDEEDGTFAEDEGAAKFATMRSGPGCIEADPDRGADDVGDCSDAEDDFWLSPAALFHGSKGPGCLASDDDRPDGSGLCGRYGIDQTKEPTGI